ncbi:MAG: alpha-ribazole phosphatase [Methylovulum sp.]|nr:alpha-ribazole phosphatase [Methylovulum sp.]
MDIYLIRHTKTAAIAGLCYGQSDMPLADSFTDELPLLQQKLPDLVEDSLVFSSPLTRCLRLSETLSDTVITDERLLELNFGAWENQRFDEIEPKLLRHWTDHFVGTAPPDGESFDDLYQRTGSFWQDLVQHNAGQVLVVTHAGVIRALLARVLSLPPANAFQFRINLGSVHKLQHIAGYTYIEYLNK